MARGTPEVQVQLPTLERWHRNLLVGLFAAYVLELVLHNAGVPLYAWLPWFRMGDGFQPWQPLTRFLVQGASREAVVGVLIWLFVLYFFLPALEAVLERKVWLRAMIAGAVAGTLVPLATDLLGLCGPGAALGWGPLVIALPVLFGLARPDADVLLLIFPVKARWFLWGTLVIALLYLMVERSLDTFQGLGVWLGVAGWWTLLGPGARRRQLKKQAASVEKELRRFQVLEGGKRTPQGPQGGDEWVH